MDNHLHLQVRFDPDLADEWLDEEVVRRWITIYLTPRGRHGRSQECPDLDRSPRERHRKGGPIPGASVKPRLAGSSGSGNVDATTGSITLPGPLAGQYGFTGQLFVTGGNEFRMEHGEFQLVLFQSMLLEINLRRRSIH